MKKERKDPAIIESEQERRHHGVKAYLKESFLNASDARPLRILAEYLEPKSRLSRNRIEDTIVFMGSARVISRKQAEEELRVAEDAQGELRAAEKSEGDLERARTRLAMSSYYEHARQLARRLTEWTKHLAHDDRSIVVCTGGGPGIMEAANRGAIEGGGESIGLGIQLLFEQKPNEYITPTLDFEFHYFFMRKFWFSYLAKAMVVMPGGFGTLDELMEIVTLIQTQKMRKKVPVVLFGKAFWDQVLNFQPMVDLGTISPEDRSLFLETDSVDEAFTYLTKHLLEWALAHPGGKL
jgi:uncharacterized protein (TIGR00730 family)